jgi:hypothetical protein
MLDKAKPYGEIYGGSDGRRFEQGGKYFDATGKLWVDPAAPAPVKTPAPVKGKPVEKTPAAVEDQVSKQLAGN